MQQLTEDIDTELSTMWEREPCGRGGRQKQSHAGTLQLEGRQAKEGEHGRPGGVQAGTGVQQVR